MEKVKRERGRPKADDPKIHPPHISIKKSTILILENEAIRRNKYQSELYQEALDHYIQNVLLISL